MKWLAGCIESSKPYHVIVVDNNSSDHTVEFISTTYKNVTLLPQKENLGFGRANNIGISYAYSQGADYVFLLNQDAYLDFGCLDSLIKTQQQYPKYGIVSPIHLNGKGNRLDKFFSLYLGYHGNKDFYSDFVLERKKSEIYSVPFVNAAAWLISRKCIETVGGFDPIFYHYGEDENYCQRVRYYNFKIGVVPNTFIFHDRENRNSKKVQRGERIHLERLEKDLKIEYGDINKIFSSEFNEVMYRRGLSKLKSYLKLNLKDAEYYSKEYSIMKKVLPEIEKSRKINTTKKAPYLNIKF